MQKKILPVAVAALMMGSLSACAPRDEATEGGGGGGMTTAERRADQATERAAEQPARAWGTSITGDERNFADAYTRTTWVHTNVIAGEWEQAGEDLQAVQESIQDLRNSANVPVSVKNQLAGLLPRVTTLAGQITRHDVQAARGASELVTRMNQLAATPAVTAWIGPRGGGAGTGGTMHQNKK